MTDPIRTPAEALEAAVFTLEAYWGHRVTPEMRDDIVAIASRIPPAPDDEALVKDLAEHMSKSHACDWPCEDPKYCQCIEEAAQAVKFLREAGALR